ncbi:MAG: SPFH domain-containing protein [Candidatus Falkowbacteria bacterium]
MILFAAKAKFSKEGLKMIVSRNSVKRWVTWIFMLLFGWHFAGIIGVVLWDGNGTPLYRVREEHAQVLTLLNGSRMIDTDVGLHLKWWALNPAKWVFNTKEQSLRIESSYLDNNAAPHPIQASDKIKFLGTGFWQYQVVDQRQFCIKMGKNALEQLANDLNGLAKGVIQSRGIEDIVSQLAEVKRAVEGSAEAILSIEKKYGVDVISFTMTSATYPDEMNASSAEAKSIRIVNEAKKESANDAGAALERLSAAYGKLIEDFVNKSGVKTEAGRMQALKTFDKIMLMKSIENRPDNTVIVFSGDGSAPNMTLPNPNSTEIRIDKERELLRPKTADNERERR